MNAIANMVLEAGEKCMPQMRLRQPRFRYSASALFTKNKERIKKLKETTWDSQYIHQKKLDKAFFKHDLAYEYFQDLHRRTAAEKIWCDKTFNVAQNPKYYGYQRDLLQWSINCLIKKLLIGPWQMKLCLTRNYQKNNTNQLLENLRKEK